MMAALKTREVKFPQTHELYRLATASNGGRPHVVPVIYALDGEDVITAVDYKTKKLENPRENPKVTLVVDEYRPNRGLMVEGDCEILERGKEYLCLLQILFDRFVFYRRNPWDEGESPILKIRPTKVVMW
jgi:nitroimidazol reductase NimA-like FMN-containing flavoprotein (pyridoxamine 5'-phosphate oxidase superfamily)